MPTRSTVRRALSAAVPLLFCACATAAPIRVPVMHPGEIDMTPYRSVAVGELRGKADRVLTEGLEEALVATNHFQVIGPSRTASALGELQLSVADLSDPARAAKLGKALGAYALIYGDADESYREEFSEDRLKEKDGAPTIIQKLFGELTVRATFRIVDGSTGRLVVTRTYEERRSDTSRATGRRPQPIDQQQLARSARADLVERFLRAVVPYHEFVTADFRKDGDLPQLESGIGFAARRVEEGAGLVPRRRRPGGEESGSGSQEAREGVLGSRALLRVRGRIRTGHADGAQGLRPLAGQGDAAGAGRHRSSARGIAQSRGRGSRAGGSEWEVGPPSRSWW